MSTASKAGIASAIPALDWIASYFSGEQGHRFNGFGKRNDHSDYFDSETHSESDLTRACVSVEWVAFSEIAQDADMVYVPCGISSGLRMHELLDQQNRSKTEGMPWVESTYKSSERLLNKTKYQHTLAENKNDNLRRARMVARLQPNAMVIAPVVREGAVREIGRTGAFSRWQQYEEEDFMAFWYPVIDRCKGMVLDGDWNFSRNSIWEMMRGVLIQAGQIPSRPDADMQVVDLEGNPVTLLARTEKLVETLKYQLGKGFEAREAATALAQIFTLDDEIRSGKLPADGQKLHKVLEQRTSKELLAMDELKAQFKPILLAHCAPYMRLDDLPQEYHEQEYHEVAKNAPQKLAKSLLDKMRVFADDVSARASKILSVEPSNALRAKLAKIHPPAGRKFDSLERFFEKASQAMMFEDDLYHKLPEWEQIALPFAIGATETGLYPAAHSMASMIFTDLKRGKEGFARAQDPHRLHKIHDMNEMAGSLGDEITEVIAHNKEAAEALKAQLKQENPHQIVVNTLSFQRIADTIEHFRKLADPNDRPSRFVAAAGASETSPLARLTLQMKYLDRSVGCAIFQEGWEHSNDLVQLRVRARLIQAGMVERPAGAQAPLHVFSETDLDTPETLLDDIKALKAEVERCANAGVRAPEQALALARLVTLHELIIDPSLQEGGVSGTTRELVNMLNAPDELTCYDRAEAKQVSEEAKQLIKEKAALWIPRERLYAEPNASDSADIANAKAVQNKRMEDYLKAQDRQKGQGWVDRSRTAHSGVEIRREGAAR